MSDQATSGQATTDAATAAPAATASAPAADTTAAPAPASTANPAASADAPATEAAAKTEASAPQGAPEKYEFKAPDGVQISDDVIGKFSETAKSLNLPQDAAQKILSEVAPAMQAQSMKALTEFYADIGGLPGTWEAQAKADKDIGGDKLNESLAAAAKARDAFGGPELIKLLDKTGLGNHPAMLRAFAKIGREISQDRFVSGGAGQSTMSSAASKLYGSN